MSVIEFIKARVRKGIATKEKRWSVISILIIIFIIITPLCGLLFQCGCDWPWLGLDEKCNFYKPHAEYHCPWCVSIVTAVLSIGLAATVGVYFAINFLSLSNQNTINQIAIRTMSGVLIFILVATVYASLIAFLQDYPLGIGR